MLKKYTWPMVGALCGVAYLLYGIFTSTNSTASIGFLFIPVFAGLGALYGLALEHIAGLFRGSRKALSLKTVCVVFLFGFTGFKFYQSHVREQQLSKAKDPATSAAELTQLRKSKDKDILQRIAGNSSLPSEELRELVSEYILDYGVLSGAASNPKLTPSEMEKMVQLAEKNFHSPVEYELYQTFVWAALVRRADFPTHLTHELAAKSRPQHFLILALIEKPEITCEEMKRFLPQKNPVLENSINLAIKKCN